jgi:MYND finger
VEATGASAPTSTSVPSSSSIEASSSPCCSVQPPRASVRDSPWSGYETQGMRDARCSLLLNEEATHDAKITALPKQRILVYQDRGYNNPATAGAGNGGGNSSGSTNGDGHEENFYVDFKGATVLQLEPTASHSSSDCNGTSNSNSNNASNSVMPITITVGGRCVFTPENYQDFRVMMRTKEQSAEMSIAPNGSFDWPDVNSLLLCPCCGNRGPIPYPGDQREHEYWMVFYPLLQITVLKGSQMTLGTRTICRLTCLECMDDMLEGLTLNVAPGGKKNKHSSSSTDGTNSSSGGGSSSGLAFALPAADVLAEAGSASFLEDGPPRPESHPHVDDILDAWTLYNLWEHSGAWEALQNNYRIMLSRSMNAASSSPSADTTDAKGSTEAIMAGGLKHRMGRPCGNKSCRKVHGKLYDGEMCRLHTKCRDCHSEFFCSLACRESSRDEHAESCAEKRRDREERREKKTRKVECDTCARKFPYTKMKKCSSCRNATYCSVDCQRMDWQRHKYSCK